MVRGLERTRLGLARLSRRDGDHHQHGARLRLGFALQALPCRSSARTSEDNYRQGSSAREWGGGHGPVRQGQQPRALSGLRHRHPRARAEAGWDGEHGQPRGSQNCRHGRSHPGGGRHVLALPPNSPDLNPIAQILAMFEADLRKATART